MQTLTETSRVGDFRFSPAFTFFAGACTDATKALVGAFLSFPTFGSAGRATFGLHLHASAKAFK